MKIRRKRNLDHAVKTERYKKLKNDMLNSTDENEETAKAIKIGRWVSRRLKR